MDKIIKSFTTTIYLHRSKDENYHIVKNAKSKGFDSKIVSNLEYLGYEDGTIKILNEVKL